MRTMRAEADGLSREFTEFQPRLFAIAYRMLGSAWDAEDVVADSMVRWMGVDRSQVDEPLAYLTTIVTRLAIDQLRSARVTREQYLGEWLPEPVVTTPALLGPLDTVERREEVSLATLRMMEALSPPERAVLVLHEAFDMPHAEIAGVLGISEGGARQHLLRAHTRLDRGARRFEPDVHDASLERFLAALEHGDLDRVRDLLAADAVAYSDGGGKARAGRRPIVGADRIIGYLSALRRYLPVLDVRRVDANAQAAALLSFGGQRMLLDIDVRDGQIREIHWIINPDKLRFLQLQLAEGAPIVR